MAVKRKKNKVKGNRERFQKIQSPPKSKEAQENFGKYSIKQKA